MWDILLIVLGVCLLCVGVVWGAIKILFRDQEFLRPKTNQEKKSNRGRMAWSLGVVLVVSMMIPWLFPDPDLSGPVALWVAGGLFLGPLILVIFLLFFRKKDKASISIE